MRPDPRQTIIDLLTERYAQAKTIFWSGSVSKNQGTSTSDLDLVVLYEKLPYAYREAYIYQEWPIDVFVHDPDTLRYFFEKVDIPSYAPSLPKMVLDGIEVPAPTDLGNHLKAMAKSLLDQGPNISKSTLDYKRFLITDLLDDLKGSKDPHEFMAICGRLHESLCAFYLLANHQWIAHGKTLIRLLKTYNPALSDQISTAFQRAYQHYTSDAIEEIAQLVFEPHDGFLWHGFRSNAPKEWRDPQIP